MIVWRIGYPREEVEELAQWCWDGEKRAVVLTISSRIFSRHLEPNKVLENLCGRTKYNFLEVNSYTVNRVCS